MRQCSPRGKLEESCEMRNGMKLLTYPLRGIGRGRSRSHPSKLFLLPPLGILLWYAAITLRALWAQPGSLLSTRISTSFAAWRPYPRLLDAPSVSYALRSPNMGAIPMSSRVLVVVEPSYEALVAAYATKLDLKPAPVVHCQSQITTMLQANRIPYDIIYGIPSLPKLLQPYDPPIWTTVYDVIIFENARLYNDTLARLSPFQLVVLGTYCQAHGTALVVLPTFYVSPPSGRSQREDGVMVSPFYPFTEVEARQMTDMRAHSTPDDPILRITKCDDVPLTDGPFHPNATVFGFNDLPIATGTNDCWWSRDSIPLATAQLTPTQLCDQPGPTCLEGKSRVPLALLKDLNVKTQLEGVKTQTEGVGANQSTDSVSNKISVAFLGGSPELWQFRLLLLDTVLYYLFRANTARSNENVPNAAARSVAFNARVEELRLNLLDRWVLVDIDDGFVGQTDPTVDEIKAMMKFQEEVRSKVPNFTFNIGYSALFYPAYAKFSGYGYRYLVENQDKFWWFPHSYDHKPSYDQLNQVALNDEITLNQKFGQTYGLTTSKHYAVSPLHSGIFPVQESLYATWSSHGIRVSSTYLYPHLYPWSARRGFTFKNISVLPRQTCGVFTHTRTMALYPKGKSAFDAMIFGGPIFDSFINNRVNVFMTHIPNYVDDQLAIYAMRHSIDFVTKYTNLKLKSAAPVQLASIFFNYYPQDKQVLWQNPCINRHHFALWQRKYDCYRIPKILIVGPQKTGTTALLTFLLLHPHLRTNIPTPAFEEVQFFSNDQIYQKGFDWYLDIFKLETSFPYMNMRAEDISFVEKSATYFDSTSSPDRAYALIPYAKIITILLDPIDRAYSWYQHVKSHGHQLAMAYTFHEIITFGPNLNKTDYSAIIKLRQRIMSPGFYSHHLKRWSVYYPANQIYVVDGNEFRIDPRPIMSELQTFLNLSNLVDYQTALKYDQKKKFYCPLVNPGVSNEQTNCLGQGKGRNYEPMENRTWIHLRNYFRPYDAKLYEWLRLNNKKVPLWLQNRIKESTTNIPS